MCWASTRLNMQVDRAPSHIDGVVRHADGKIAREDLVERQPHASIRVHEECWGTEHGAHDVLIVDAGRVGHPLSARPATMR